MATHPTIERGDDTDPLEVRPWRRGDGVAFERLALATGARSPTAAWSFELRIRLGLELGFLASTPLGPTGYAIVARSDDGARLALRDVRLAPPHDTYEGLARLLAAVARRAGLPSWGLLETGAGLGRGPLRALSALRRAVASEPAFERRDLD